jgi:hypothetical protein
MTADVPVLLAGGIMAFRRADTEADLFCFSEDKYQCSIALLHAGTKAEQHYNC